MSLLDLFSFSSLLFRIIILAILPVTMLGYYSMSASSMPSKFFLVVSIYWKPASYRSSLDLSSFGMTTNRSAAMLNFFLFLFGPTCMLFDLSIALRLRHDLSKVAAPTPRSGLVIHVYHWVPTD
jgi:membrane protein required for beta-lactamase induction